MTASLLPSGTFIIGKEHVVQSFRFDAVTPYAFPEVATIGAGVANTTIQGSLLIPNAFKIAKVAVSFGDIDALTTDAFNIVVGTDSYTQGTLAPPDNSAVYGYPTQFAAAGDTVFGDDMGFNVTNFPNATTSGGVAVFAPPVWDAIYPAGSVLTLRASTVASTGSIADLLVALCVKLIDVTPFNDSFVPTQGW